MKRKCTALLFVLCFVLSPILSFATYAQSAPLSVGAEDIVILYTNDTHSYIYQDENDPNALSFDNVAALKESHLTLTGGKTLLVDAGDHAQGTPYASIDNGLSIIDMMNEAGYDFATAGNHEFDYGIEGFDAIRARASFSYLSCNFTDLRTNQLLLEPYQIVTFGETKIALIGISTPETITSADPTYFQDGNGTYLYSALDQNNGQDLYQRVQDTIDTVKTLGADYVIALAHLGLGDDSAPFRSVDVIRNTVGLDALIDGHSHTTVAEQTETDKNGNNVLLTQTGEYFNTVGKMVIRADGRIETALVTDCTAQKQSVTDLRDACVSTVHSLLGEKIANNTVPFRIYDELGNRTVRIKETNMANFVSDSFYYYLNCVENLDCDITLINGGGVRSNATDPEWTYLTMQTVLPYQNVLCLIEVTGQQILDALEFGARVTTGQTGEAELGAFLAASGLTYEIDTSIPSTVQLDSKDNWIGAPDGAYRVHSVKLYNKESGIYEPLDLTKTYRLGSINFLLRSYGDGFTMFRSARLVKDFIGLDYAITAEYAKAFTDTDSDGYAEIASQNSPLKTAYPTYTICYEDTENASGRILFRPTPQPSPISPDPTPQGLPTGTVIWIVSGSVLGTAGITVLVIWIVKKKKIR